MTDETPEVHRQPLNYLCWIVAKGAQDGKIPARITAISKSGARLTTEQANSVPEEFVLNLTKDGLVRRACRVTWRKPDEIGIDFIQKKATVKAAAKPVKQGDQKPITPLPL